MESRAERPKAKRRLRVMVVASAIMMAILVALIWYGCSLKCERTVSPTDARFSALVYYRGLGLSSRHTWYGRYKVKMVDNGYSHRSVKSGSAESSSLPVTMEVLYYPNGAIESECPKRGNMDADGVHKCYHENGRLAEEIGIRVDHNAPCVCCTFINHGPLREYHERGKLTLEKWFINGLECTKRQWADWLKKHPEDVLYAGADGHPR